ncbi:DEAD/DEAH box helicase [Melittangium boletus]|uniref:DEAD-box ATP-dependent RNA helicase RhpA n=1 Tax=Melittangium boletus DSM 14713 TaxID=1294270 RepID=A0A250IJ57_9BACT|nr:DEAD/DEAH box helicase [Melittangium boletus]ATB31795.1 ATP-dependent RNA helicase RhlE [Melittangium boletus DSM 14713]
MTFEDLKLAEPLLRAVKAEGYTSPTPIQQQAIPHVLEGKDVLGCAQTGTGKTAAFTLPILQRLSVGRPSPPARGRPIRALVLSPTRELAAQIGDSVKAYGRHTGLTSAVIFGGVGQSAQEQALKSGVDILVATPGRLLDLMSQGFVSYKSLEVFVLDEADRMLDMGFIHDVKRVIAALPRQKQTLFFSATMPPEIQGLANSILVKPVRVEVAPVATTAETIDQRLYFVEKEQKRGLLVHLLQSDTGIQRALVFTRTKHGANRVARHLEAAGIGAEPIHGNKSQNARERALAAFKSGACRVLVATDIAARGIDIDGISHVINFDLPNVPETYVHRIGRTGRAGAAGIALSFCDGEERAYLKDIERTIRRRVPVVEAGPYRVAPAPASERDERPERRPQNEGRHAPRQARPQSSGGNPRGGNPPRGESRGGGRGGEGNGGRRRQGGRDGRSAAPRGQDSRPSRNDRPSGSQAPASAPAAPAAASQRPRAPKWL